MPVSEKERNRRLDRITKLIKYMGNSPLFLIHTEKAHEKVLNEGVMAGTKEVRPVTDFFKEAKDIFNEYPKINAKTIFERYLEDDKNGVKRIKWDLIPAAQYHNLLKRYMEMGEFARVPRNIVSEWYGKIKKNTVILYYLSYMFHRKHGFPFEIVPFKTEDPMKAQIWILTETNFYNWATFENGVEAWTDMAFEDLFPLLKEYREDMTPEEILILINKLIHVIHIRSNLSDISLAFIEGGVKMCDKITNGE